MNANVVYGVCNGDSAGYTTGSNYSSDLSGSVGYYGGVNTGSVNGSGSSGSGQASTPDSIGSGTVGGTPHYLLSSTHSLAVADPRTPPLTPHDQQNLLASDNGLSYTNLDANGYSNVGSYHGVGIAHHGPPHAGMLVPTHSQHLPVSSVSVGNGVNSAVNSAVNSNPYHTDYTHHGPHQGVLSQQHSHSNPLHSHPHAIQHHHPQSHHHGHPSLGHGDSNGLSAVAIPGATPGYAAYPDVTQYGARTHPMSLGPGPGFTYGGHSVAGVLRDQCQVNGMLSLAGLGPGHPAHQGNNVNHVTQQQPNVPTYKWMQVKRNVPKPGKLSLISIQ